MNHHRLKNRFTKFLNFSLLTNFVSLRKLIRFISKTLDFLRMDSLFFSADSADDDAAFFGNSSFHSLSDLDSERLYLVNHRWWNETREALFSGIGGVLFDTSSCLVESFDSEIVLDMRRIGMNGEDVWIVEGDEGVSGREYALVSEWMFYRALKWLDVFN